MFFKAVCYSEGWEKTETKKKRHASLNTLDRRGGRPDPGVDPGSNQAAVVRAVPGDMRYVAGGVDER